MFQTFLTAALLCLLQVSTYELDSTIDSLVDFADTKEDEEFMIKTNDPKFMKLMRGYIHKDQLAWTNYTTKHLDEKMNKMKLNYLLQFKKAYPEENWKEFYKFIAKKENRITTYYQGQLKTTYEKLEAKLYTFTIKNIQESEGKEMSNHKAKFWIKSSLDLFNKYAE